MNPTPTSVRPTDAARTLSLALPAVGGPAVLEVTGAPWIDGLVHPLDEVTHLAALLILGIAAAFLGGRSRWGLPILFTALLVFGLVLGTQGAVAPMRDTIIMTSGLALMLLILGRVRLVFATVATITGAFALFHGVADGFAMRAAKSGLDYLAGYAATNVVAMVLGVMIGEWLHRQVARWAEHLHHWTDRLHGLRLGG